MVEFIPDAMDVSAGLQALNYSDLSTLILG